METARLLVARFAGDAASTALREALQAGVRGRYEINEVILRDAPGDGGKDLLTPAMQRETPRILVFCPGTRRAREEVGRLMDGARRSGWEVPVMVILESLQPDELCEIVKLGISDFLTLPLRREEVLARVWALDRGDPESGRVFAQLYARQGLGQIIGENRAFISALHALPKIARCDSGVLLKGETGTGKEVVARAIHYLSPRAAKPFVPVNCGAIPLDLLENEFFGHEAGAFTSASHARRGLVQEADGGTLFLDEIDCLPLTAQVKLLRFLQDGHFRPLGAERACRGNVRVIAASNADFSEALASGRFRQDLYYRLNVLSVTLPPLRERADDILLLARHFLDRFARKLASPARDFAPATRMKLCCHDWPGNVRELENVVERAVVLAEAALIQPHEIRLQDAMGPETQASFHDLKAVAIERFERNYLRQALVAHGGNITKAAESAHKNRRAFWELLRKHHIVARPKA